ncbi:hypothetical protein AcW1_006712 [Taiwanofungus camphoratus]|nr:hypothetical protein AcV5_009300 [Antrodia cinnamomea]KAI0924657.1 hypothetical protein AcW2_005476 [Antrodia cinnamomea]KAI0953981.1 hypothetical protein AcV7_007355 [Antrodia cinnamomea]KAI0954993.1 hypothetical protein AcW1_006712 [Antrodia cinnamomea]
MYSSTSFPSSANLGVAQDSRPSFSHSHSHAGHQGSPFSVAGMSSPGATHGQSFRGSTMGGGSLSMSMSGSLGMGSPLGEGLSQSRTHYQPGYMMSAAQNSALPPGSQRHEETPIVQTKAKLNHVLAGGSVSDFGMDSMFESSRQRQRQALPDEDAPPTNSVNDIVNEVYPDTGSPRFPLRNSTFDPSASRTSLCRSSHPSTPKPAAATSQSPMQPLYVIIFGYPPDKYSVTVEYFRALGETTEPEQNPEIMNCFRIGYMHPAEAMRAVRKNGEVLSGSWMIGAKWADPAQAESLLGASIVRGALQSEFGVASPDAMPFSASGSIFPSSTSRMSVDELAFGRSPPAPSTPTPTVGTPIRLAPSTAAFRRGAGTSTFMSGSPQKAQSGQGVLGGLPTAAVDQSPSKGVLEQVSDLIFGW